MTGLRALWPAAVVFAVDQLAKGLVVIFVTGPLAVAPFLNIVLVHNTGAAFGFLNRTGGWSNILFMVIAVVVSVIIVRMLRGPTGRDPQIALALQWILGGALGNLFDRVFRGAVVDFIDFYIGDWHWFTFNLADVAIALGAALLVADALGWRLIGAGDARASDDR